MSINDSTGAQHIRTQVRHLWLSVVPEGATGTFADAGGDSLSGLRLLGAVYKSLGIRVAWDDLNSAADADDFANRVAARSE
jgi:hypothetical protein